MVHNEVARRLIPLGVLAAAIRASGTAEDLPTLAQSLDVDTETLQLRFTRLDRSERRLLRRSLILQAPLWDVA